MSTHTVKLSCAGLWLTAGAAAAVSGGISSVPSGIALAAVALLPPVLMFLVWQDPQAAVAQILNEAEK